MMVVAKFLTVWCLLFCTTRIVMGRSLSLDELDVPPGGQCRITDWFDRDNPSGVCDCENLSGHVQAGYLDASEIVMSAECVRTTDNLPYDQTGDVFRVPCTVEGLDCRNSDQPSGGYCSDYKVRYYTCVDTYVDECSVGIDKCDDNAECIDTTGSYTCTCNIGYEGDGFTCTAITDSYDLHATCDDQMDLYVDGQAQSASSSELNAWNKVSTFRLSNSARLVAIHCKDLMVAAGIFASTTTGMVTDSSWKCSSQYQAGWMEPGFDTTSWQAARQVGKHGVSPWGLLPPISMEAYWIWTAGRPSQVYCRKTLDPVNVETTTTTTTTPAPPSGYNCGDNNPCTPENIAVDLFYWPHELLTNFVQCSAWGQCWVMPCAPGTVWDPAITACNFP